MVYAVKMSKIQHDVTLNFRKVSIGIIFWNFQGLVEGG